MSEDIITFPDGYLICGSYPDIELPIKTFPLIVIDPPYSGIVSDDWDQCGDQKNYANYLISIVKSFSSIITPGGAVYIWGGIGKKKNRPFMEFLSRVENECNGWTLSNLITWSKKRAYGKSNDYLFTREECAWLTYGEKPSIFNIPLLEKLRGYAGYNLKFPANE